MELSCYRIPASFDQKHARFFMIFQASMSGPAVQQLWTLMELTRQLQDIKQMDVRDNMQKSKIKWAIEGDENSKYFHSIINKKRTQLSIRGVFVDGNWTTDPEEVKEVFKDHFANRFKQPVQGRLKLNALFPDRLSTDQVADMDRCISRDEIRAAVWDCGEMAFFRRDVTRLS
ncbi:hypothetical protein Tco_1481473 [Tanacetum coccineum]